MKYGDYEATSELGRGGMGVVLRGRGPAGVEVAIKVLKRASAGNSLARFERERRLLAGLGVAEGFVPLLDAGESKEGPYFVMPLLGGGTLRDRLKRGPLAVAETVRIGRALAEALARAHEKGIVHRDLKPENVLFDSGDRPLVCDLGMAKHFRRDTPGASGTVSLTRDGSLLGTIGYAAPEQAQDAGAAGPEADVFSLGAILHECLAGEPCFAGSSPAEVVTKLIRDERSPLARTDVPRWLLRAIDGALATDPRKRPKDGAALRAALEGSLDDASRRAPKIAALVGLLAAGAVGTAAALHARSGPPPSDASTRGATVERVTSRTASPPSARVVVVEPPEIAAAVSRAILLSDTNQDREALAVAEKAAQEAPDCAGPYAARARAQRHLEHYADAHADASYAIELDPRNGFARLERAMLILHLHRSVAARSQDELHVALTDLDVLVALEPKNPTGWLQRCLVHRELGRNWDAMSDGTQAIELAPDDYHGWLYRGSARSRANDGKGALADIEKALKLGGLTAETYTERGRARFAAGDIDGAIEDYDRAVTMHARYADAYRARGHAYLKARREEDAIGDYRRYLELAPEGPDAAPLRDKLEKLGAGER